MGKKKVNRSHELYMKVAELLRKEKASYFDTLVVSELLRTTFIIPYLHRELSKGLSYEISLTDLEKVTGGKTTTK